jgi:hypothetical protein
VLLATAEGGRELVDLSCASLVQNTVGLNMFGLRLKPANGSEVCHVMRGDSAQVGRFLAAFRTEQALAELTPK